MFLYQEAIIESNISCKPMCFLKEDAPRLLNDSEKVQIELKKFGIKTGKEIENVSNMSERKIMEKYSVKHNVAVQIKVYACVYSSSKLFGEFLIDLDADKLFIIEPFTFRICKDGREYDYNPIADTFSVRESS